MTSLKGQNSGIDKTASANSKFAQKWLTVVYVNSSQLNKFIRADKFLLSKPLQHKLANRYRKSYTTL
jgi:hypothetical protein